MEDCSTDEWLQHETLCVNNWCKYVSIRLCVMNPAIGPAVIKSPFHATGSARTAVGLFLLLVRRSGTHCLKTCGIRSVLWTVTDSHSRHFYCHSTSVFSALEVCYDNALYKLTFDIDIVTSDWAWCTAVCFLCSLLD